MRKRSKRYKADAAKVDIQKKYATPEAVKILKSFTPTKADQSIEIAVKLVRLRRASGIDTAEP